MTWINPVLFISIAVAKQAAAVAVAAADKDENFLDDSPPAL